MASHLLLCSMLTISLVAIAQCSPVSSRWKRDDKPAKPTPEEQKSQETTLESNTSAPPEAQTENLNRTTDAQFQREIHLAIGLAMKPFLKVMDENVKIVQTLKQTIEEMLKLIKDWIAKNGKDNETDEMKNKEKNAPTQTTKVLEQTNDYETSQVEGTTAKPLNTHSGDEKIYTCGEFKLTIINKVLEFSEETRQRIIDTFNTVYPKIRERFNNEATKDVTLIIDPEYADVAKTLKDVITINPAHFKENPLDMDTITHELMHIVQSSYPSHEPIWLVEGLADYARWKYGRDTHPSKLVDFQPEQKYTDSYKVTARFLVWLETKVNDKVVNGLNKGLQENRYHNGQLWHELTQKSVDDLWNEYAKNPDL